MSSGYELDSLSKGLKSKDFNLVVELVKQIEIKDPIIHRFLAFLLAAERPLSGDEMKELLSVDVRDRKISSAVDIQEPVRRTHDLVILRNGRLNFKHSVIRAYMLGLCGQALTV